MALYLAGDAQAAAVAERYRVAQEACTALRADKSHENVFDQAARFFLPKDFEPGQKELAAAEKAFSDAQECLKRLAR